MEVQKRGKVSEWQKQVLLQFLEDNPNVKSGKFSANFTYKTAQRSWQTIAEQLNAIGPVQKSWCQWRKTWQDMKTKAKTKGGELRREREKTGGGPPTNTLITDVDEERILNLIGPVCIGGHPNTKTSRVVFSSEDEAEPLAKQRITEHFPQTPSCSYMQNMLKPEPVTLPTLEISSTQTYPLLHNTTQKPSTPPPLVSTSFTTETDFSTSTLNQKDNTVITMSKTPNRYGKSRRLENSILATTTLSKQMQRKIEIKEKYYAKKLKIYEDEIVQKRRLADVEEKRLKLYEQDIIEKRRIANALESIATEMAR
ncbi:hypothetical protein RN001_005637 [Aquatica leii]|uniref:Regulatory protein zeste n=1 Tax=Aquatica leii TaxID=1421715 RepID=A0AAN7QKG4_9COLE|nr:hypothetical protein RN001_005637 [Aquatica leii]